MSSSIGAYTDAELRGGSRWIWVFLLSLIVVLGEIVALILILWAQGFVL